MVVSATDNLITRDEDIDRALDALVEVQCNKKDWEGREVVCFGCG